jgi:type VI secretion system protein ImpH
MAGKNRNKNADIALKQALKHEPYRFGFFEALRQLECINSDSPRFGQSLRPMDDPVRLGQIPDLKFAPATLASFTEKGEFAPLLQVYFFGLFGPNGPLPTHLTEYARQRLRNAKDPVPAAFMDMFHHRLLSLFYRAWADKEPTVSFDRPEDDRFGFYLGTLLGLEQPDKRQQDAMPVNAKLHFAGHLGCHTKHAEGLSAILSNYFHIPAKIQEFVGEWLDIPIDDYCYLDQQDTTGQLGKTSVIGTRSWQCQNKFSVRFGPLSIDEYQQMLPTGNRLKTLRDMVRNYIGFEFSWSLNLLLKEDQVPTAQLGESARLGWSSWLHTENRMKCAEDLHLLVENYAIQG